MHRRLQVLKIDQEKARKRTREEWLARLREIRAMQLKPVERESWELIRDDRDSRWSSSSTAVLSSKV